jgi:hypothetical protein
MNSGGRVSPNPSRTISYIEPQPISPTDKLIRKDLATQITHSKAKSHYSDKNVSSHHLQGIPKYHIPRVINMSPNLIKFLDELSDGSGDSGREYY